jgi:hypothetical protein
MPQPTSGGTVRHPSPAPDTGIRPDEPGDDFLAALLIRMWALASGRTLRSDVPPDQLSAEELIAFWADDMTSQAGRHARPGGAGHAPGARDPGKAARQAPQPRRTKRPRSAGRVASSRQELPAGPAAA